MTINEIRKEVCKRANELIKCGYRRKWSFQWAWESVKKELNQIKASELKAGDKVRIEFGDYGNVCNATVKSVKIAEEKYLKDCIKVVAESNGREFEFCSTLSDRFDKAA